MIRLRALEPEDLDSLYAIENAMEEWEYGCCNVPFSRYALRDYIANNSYDIYADKQVRQVITDESNAVLGLIDLCNFEPKHLRAEVSIVVSPLCRKRGVAHQAMQSLIGYADETLHLSQLYAIVSESNVAAKSLFIKSGFEHTATLKAWLSGKAGRENALLFQIFLKK